jgi:transcription initiation factor TFIIIB Brf1 subunit/transcription initiation factor TFIIB
MPSYLHMMNQCTRCSYDDVVYDPARGDMICRGCGNIVSARMIDESSEWRVYENDVRTENDVARCSTNVVETAWSDQNVFVGGTEAQRSSLLKAQIATENKKKIRAARYVVEVQDISSRLNVTRSIMVSVCFYFIHVCVAL